MPIRLGRPVVVWLSAIAAVILVAYAAYLVLAYSLVFECSDDVRQQVGSPDGRFVATHFIRNCGATTTLTSIVSIDRSASRSNPNPDSAVLITDETCPTAMTWRGDTLMLTLTPSCPIAASVRLSKGQHILLDRQSR